MTKIIDLSIKEKTYKSKNSQLSILNNFNLAVAAGEKTAIVGESGVGKSSLLNIIGLIDRNYVGAYTLFGSKTNSLHTSELAQWRNQKIGFVLQESALINSLTIEDNIKLPLLYAGSGKKEFKAEDFESVVDAIGIKPILKKKPLECSGGEKARAVFARGVIMKPQIILADEPTASLDVENKERIVTLLFKMNKEFSTTIITVTHDLEIANRHDRVIHLERNK
ncbi:ABC transporter ATP-binding protein [Petralouisia muris]|uniref:ABC transporter ATP-binding protein n=1 Tax=Petralouisia muris TaxID=3032872 RepID=A0AC61RVE4_9FIRM|nr:ABC transporter ATP-binding protein [Petralouisia muris]TGY95829.1 ABC transporter ATP-binding protein [Petralouisia muris]